MTMTWMSGRCYHIFFPPNTIQVSNIDTLGDKDFDLIHAWNNTTGLNSNLEDPTYFIKNARSIGSIPDLSHSRSASPSSFSDKQRLCFETVIEHFHEGPNADPLKMIIQGTAGIGKYYLIHCIGHEFSMHSINGKIPLLLLAPTGLVAFNIRAKTIHSAFRIPIKDFKYL